MILFIHILSNLFRSTFPNMNSQADADRSHSNKPKSVRLVKNSISHPKLHEHELSPPENRTRLGLFSHTYKICTYI